jgi:hypothetical protein
VEADEVQVTISVRDRVGGSGAHGKEGEERLHGEEVSEGSYGIALSD